MNEEEPRKIPGIMVYHDEVLPVISMLTDAETGALFRALVNYFAKGDDSTEFEDRAVAMEYNRLKLSIARNQEQYRETCRKRAEAAKKRWQKKQDDANECPAGNDNPKDNANSNDKPKSKSKTNASVNANTSPLNKGDGGDAHPPRSAYGEYGNVLLSDSELEKLKSDFPRDWAALIEELSTAMQSKGMHYKDHLATLRAWAKKDGIKRQGGPVLPAEEKPKPKTMRGRSPDDIMRDPDHPGQWILKPEVAAREAAAAAESSGGELT